MQNIQIYERARIMVHNNELYDIYVFTIYLMTFKSNKSEYK